MDFIDYTFGVLQPLNVKMPSEALVPGLQQLGPEMNKIG